MQNEKFETSLGHVLVVDDDPFVLKTLSFSLMAMGCRYVVTSTDVSQALLTIQNSQPPVEIILSDLNIPGIDGIEFFRRLVEANFSGGIILISGEGSRTLSVAENLARVRGLNVLGSVSKPVKMQTLRSLIRNNFTPESRTTDRNVPAPRLVSAEALKHAITAGKIEPWFQPKIDLLTARLVGVEALARWIDPSEGTIYPDQFIPVAEQHDLMDELTMLMLNKTLEHRKRWKQEGLELFAAVNVSMSSLYDLNFPDRVEAAIKAANEENSNIVLEVTESQLMRELEGPMDNLVRLRLKMIGLSIDDFGTGHSNLQQLRDLPFDELKLDRSFVHGATVSDTTRTILEASFELAKRLNLTVVAEGVENQSDWNRVLEMGCDQAQGYFIARPMPGREIIDWAKSWKERSAHLIHFDLAHRL
ncbi:EAL domain-containing protein [Motiliproteus sp. MSK22-1]|uniref:EAL domain-containing response regulator n=1 Tax=Motiliproteus sp. MSK22-1 TaxID=1897630 RepID=UPI000978B93C|nr:EAL domain-containing response regulator [Motiliproteus sp. MSK22-1]OMH26258.1 hypothetical protein BGP75_01105 [Motiliproteus sp. MSK22-1]